MEYLIIFAVYLLLSYVIAKYIGTKRYIGFKFSLLFSLFLTPFWGGIITLCSRRTTKYVVQAPNRWYILGAILIIIVAILNFAAAIQSENIFTISVVIGQFVWAWFCIERSKGINYVIHTDIIEEPLLEYNNQFDSNKSSNINTNNVPTLSSINKEKQIKINTSTKTRIEIDIDHPKDVNKKATKLEAKELNSDLSKVNLLFTNYSDEVSEQIQNYPKLYIPNNNTIVKSYRIGQKNNIRGYKEKDFENLLRRVLHDKYKVFGNLSLYTSDYSLQYEPDIAVVDLYSNKNIRIDIEIDEPYAAVSRKPIHCDKSDLFRDIYFKDRGWIVIRFTEKQVHQTPNASIKFVTDILNKLNPTNRIEFTTTEKLQIEKTWDILQAQKWEKLKYRENYLNHTFSLLNNDIIPVTNGAETISESNEELLVKPSLRIATNEEEKHVINTIGDYTPIGIVASKDTIRFNQDNYHPRDKNIKFYPDSHTYLVNGLNYTPVSTLLTEFFPEFDAYYWSMRKSNHDEENAARLRKQWKNKGQEAANLGTILHESIEEYYLHKKINDSSEEFNLFLEFENDHKFIKPFRSEWRIYDNEFQIAGTIDLLADVNGKFHIYDWKRSSKILDSYGNPIAINIYQNGIGPLSHLPDTSYNKYCIQQSLYKYILSTNYNIEVDKLYLIVLHPTYDQYYKVEVPYLEDEVKEILKAIHTH